MSYEKISSFLEEAGFGHDKATGEPLVSTLTNYFESTKCIDFDYTEGNLKVSFNIFTDGLNEDHESGDIENSVVNEKRRPPLKRFVSSTVEGNKTCQTYWFLKLLAKEKSLAQLCHHPYITAFLELHYSTVQKARTQMQDSVPHLALVLLLLVLVSTLPYQGI